MVSRPAGTCLCRFENLLRSFLAANFYILDYMPERDHGIMMDGDADSIKS
jgi:hypothetical protein